MPALIGAATDPLAKAYPPPLLGEALPFPPRLLATEAAASSSRHSCRSCRARRACSFARRDSSSERFIIASFSSKARAASSRAASCRVALASTILEASRCLSFWMTAAARDFSLTAARRCDSSARRSAICCFCSGDSIYFVKVVNDCLTVLCLTFKEVKAERSRPLVENSEYLFGVGIGVSCAALTM